MEQPDTLHHHIKLVIEDHAEPAGSLLLEPREMGVDIMPDLVGKAVDDVLKDDVLASDLLSSGLRLSEVWHYHDTKVLTKRK